MMQSIFFLSKKFLSGKSKFLSLNSLLSIIGIFIGCITLTVTASIINGLQKSIIDSMIEVNSYHLRIQGDIKNLISKGLVERIEKLEDAKVVFSFYDLDVIVKTADNRSANILLKLVQKDIFDKDEGFDKNIKKSKNLNHIGKNEILIPINKYFELNLRNGKRVEVFPLNQKNIFMPKTYPMKVIGFFSTDFVDYNDYIAFSNINSHISEVEDIKIGIKIKNKYKVEKIKKEIEQIINQAGIKAKVSTWRDYNKALFSALGIEKASTMFLISMIFLLVAINLGQNLEKLIYKKKDEIAILFSMGFQKTKVAYSLVLTSILIGIAGSSFGILFGILIFKNLKDILSFLFSFSKASTIYSGGNYAYNLLSSVNPYVNNTDLLIIYFSPIILCIIFCLISVSKLSKINTISILKNDF